MYRNLLGVFTLALVFTGACSVFAAETNLVNLTSRMGWDGMGKQDGFVPLIVDVENRGEGFTGTVQAVQTRRAGDELVRFEQPLAMPAGSKKRVSFQVPADATAPRFELSVVGPGGPLTRRFAAVNVLAPDVALIGALSADPLAFGTLAQVRSGGRPGSVRVAPVTAEDLPDSLSGFEHFDALAIARFNTATLNQAQVAAIEAWVRRGGLLILAAGPEWRATFAGLPPNLLPVEALGSRPVLGLDVFSALGGVSLGDKAAEIATGRLRHGRVLVSHGQDPVLSVSRLGNGMILYLALDPSLEPFASWSGAPVFWEKLLLQYQGSTLWSPGSQVNYRNPAVLARVLDSITTLRAPAWQTSALLLGVYCILVGPLAYGVLKWLQRPSAWWLAAPLIGVIGIAVLYAVGIRLQGDTVHTQTVSVTAFTPGEPRALARTYVGIYAPGSEVHPVDLPQGYLAAPLPFTDTGAEPASVSTRVVYGQGAEVYMTALNPWALRGLVLEREVPAPSGLEFDITLERDRLRGRITNNTAQTINEGVVATPFGYQTVETMPPGASAQVDVGLNPNTRYWRPIFQQLYPSIPGFSSDPKNRANRRLVLEAAMGATPELPPGPVSFFGWADDPPADLEPLGEQRGGIHLLHALITPKVDRQRFDIPPGLILGRLVGAEGSQRGRSPAGYFLAGGALFFSLQAPDVDRSVVEEVQLYLDSAGMGEVPRLSALNWHLGRWEDLEQKSLQTLDKWERYLSGDGSLLLKVEVPGEGREIRLPTLSMKGGGGQ